MKWILAVCVIVACVGLGSFEMDRMLSGLQFIQVMTGFPTSRGNYSMRHIPLLTYEHVLGVVVAHNIILGPAQFEVRQHLERRTRDAVAVVAIFETDEYGGLKTVPYHGSKANYIEIPAKFNYNSTMAYNIGKITFGEDRFQGKFPVISSNVFPVPGDTLIAVYLQGIQVVSKPLKVIDFRYCLHDFEPDKDWIYNRLTRNYKHPGATIIDPMEQICIKILKVESGNKLPNTLLFFAKNKTVFYVGNISKIGNKHGVASMIGHSCGFINRNLRGPNICRSTR